MPRIRLRPLLIALLALVVLASMIVLINVIDRPNSVASSAESIKVAAAPGTAERITIDAQLYLPQQTPAAAVLLSPGFAATKQSLADEANELARRGFVALAYTPRGFGDSGGQIELNSPDAEVADARALVTWLSQRREVHKDRTGDPRIAVTGGSYGGALALMLAGTDKRIDAVAAAITYHDLSSALLPNATASHLDESSPAPSGSNVDGVFKRAWAGNLFGAGLGGRDQQAKASRCGRFSAAICAVYTTLATTGRADPKTIALLRRHSPISYASNIHVPTMLVQGEQDTLFGLDQAQANAAQIRRAGTDVHMAWYAGGHDGQLPDEQIRTRIADFLAAQLDPDATARADLAPTPAFSYAVPGTLRGNGKQSQSTVTSQRYPSSVQRQRIGLVGKPQTATNPPGGLPAAISSVPGLGAQLAAVAPAAARVARDVPAQFATFESQPLSRQIRVAGASTTTVTVQGRDSASEAVLFAKLYDVGPDGSRTLPGSAVAPIRVRLPADRSPVTVAVALPAIVSQIQPGHRLALTISTTDAAYQPTNAPYSVHIGLAGDSSLAVPVIEGTTKTGEFPTAQVIGIAVILALILTMILIITGRRRWRHRRTAPDDHRTEDPVVLRSLGKVYNGDLAVVDGLSFTVEAGQVVGLLGPNGAGKTTTLRMMMGLVTPTAGEARLFGELVEPGAPVLSRVGAFVERAGFLPHLSGRANLESYWQATGRAAEEAAMDEALEIADLGTAVQRKVGTYSQGMRQRLAIAQAMLGLPELLILDEPTNGLDPPQIHHMRSVLRRYAETGRTVLVSSHLLAEVEQTCSHVVVMDKGTLVAAGPVEDLVSGGGEATFTVDAPERAAQILRELPTVTEVEHHGEHLEVHATLHEVSRAQAVHALVQGGVQIHQVGPRRRLEDAFLRLIGDRT